MHIASRTSATLDRSTLLVALGAALVPFAYFAWRFDFICDDAFISFRYSRHFAQGHGLLFNLGESPPVEGYSNFLWVIWLSLFERLGIDITIAARATSILCGALLIATVTRFVQRRVPLTNTALAATAVAFACSPCIGLWSTGGLETMPFAWAAFLVFERLSVDPDRPRGVQAGGAALACALLRADGFLWAALMIAAALLPWLFTRSRSLLRAALIALAIAVAGTLAHALWRHGYYGEWLPNTARIKAGLSLVRLERGALYAAAFLLAVPVCLAVMLAAFVRPSGWREFLNLQAAFVIAVTFLYAIFIGGDFMPMGRFLIVAMPFFALLLASSVRALPQHPPIGVGFALGCAAFAVLPSFDVQIVPAAVRERFHFRWNDPRVATEYEMWRGMRERAEQWSLLGRALARETRPGESIVLGNIGAIGYYTELSVLDVFGLTSRAVAFREAPLVRASPGHDKAVPPEFFFDERPTYWSAFIAPVSAPLDAGLPPGFLESPTGRRISIERRPLSVAHGFPPGVELRLLRMRWE